MSKMFAFISSFIELKIKERKMKKWANTFNCNNIMFDWGKKNSIYNRNNVLRFFCFQFNDYTCVQVVMWSELILLHLYLFYFIIFFFVNWSFIRGLCIAIAFIRIFDIKIDLCAFYTKSNPVSLHLQQQNTTLPFR